MTPAEKARLDEIAGALARLMTAKKRSELGPKTRYRVAEMAKDLAFLLKLANRKEDKCPCCDGCKWKPQWLRRDN